MEISPPKRIYQYEIIDPVGRGKNGAVYLGRDSAGESTVAVKLLLPEVATDSIFISRCLPQLRAARVLTHPNLVGLQDIIQHEDQILLVSEFVDGVGLDTRLEQGPVPPNEFLDIAQQAAQGLKHLHSNGVVHGNIQPSNLLVTDNGTVRLTDFGLPRRLADSRPEVNGFRPGTARYASPEEVNLLNPTPASDLFSLGIVFYQLLTGRPPFPGESVEELKRQILTFRPDFGLVSKYHVPGEIVLLLKRLLRAKSEERCTETGELLATLEAAQTLERELSSRVESGSGQQSSRVYLLLSLLAVLMVLVWSIIAGYR